MTYRSPPCRWAFTQVSSLPTYSGIYIFWSRSKGRCLYVGQTSCLRRRLLEHWSGSHNVRLSAWIRYFGSDLDFCYARVPEGAVSRAERLVISGLRPWFNQT